MMNVQILDIKFGKQVQLQGQVLMPDVTNPVPGAILCHGLGSGWGAVRSSGLSLAKHGIASLIFDFRGHGGSEGIFDGNEAEDVIAAWQWLSQFDGVDGKRIALIGHSAGARAAILAASEVDSPYAIVALSTPPDLDGKLGQDVFVYLEHWVKRGAEVMEYPKQGALPWLGGVYAMITRAWMYLRGYRLCVNWHKCFKALPNRKLSSALQRLGGCPKLFVHCRGDRQIPYQTVLELYEKAPEPKELILANGGYHGTPLMPGNLRRRWISWVVNVLMNGERSSFLRESITSDK